jgi:hypothetical protein
LEGTFAVHDVRHNTFNGSDGLKQLYDLHTLPSSKVRRNIGDSRFLETNAERPCRRGGTAHERWHADGGAWVPCVAADERNRNAHQGRFWCGVRRSIKLPAPGLSGCRTPSFSLYMPAPASSAVTWTSPRFWSCECLGAPESGTSVIQGSIEHPSEPISIPPWPPLTICTVADRTNIRDMCDFVALPLEGKRSCSMFLYNPHSLFPPSGPRTVAMLWCTYEVVVIADKHAKLQ